MKERKTKIQEKKRGGVGEREWRRTPGRVRASHVIWPEPVSGAVLIEAEDDGSRHGYRFSGQTCLLQIVEYPELWQPAALGKGASHIVTEYTWTPITGVQRQHVAGG